MLRIEERDGKDYYDITRSTEQSMLKLFAFATQFVYLLKEGLKTFNTPKYRQFAKRLGRLIRQTVHFVSDHWENFKSAKTSNLHPSMYQRLQLEYDCFFLRATKCIFSSLKLGIWQYLADIPYGTISSDMLWRIFYVLHLDYQEESHNDFGSEITDWVEVMSSPDLQIQFEEKCAEAEETELFFLLSAFANMGVSRKRQEEVFIKRVVMDLFYIGFVSETTREANCRNCRDLLSSVCSKHPFLLSYMVQVLKLKIFDIGKLSSYLVQELPWNLMQPVSEDLSVLFNWLQSPISGYENATARIVLSQFNWEFGHLPIQHHITTAITIIEVHTKFTERSDSQGIVNSSVNTINNLAMATLSPCGSQEQQFTKWCWELLSRLRLHMMDRSLREYDALLSGNPEIFSDLLDFDLSPQIETVVNAAVGKQPMACYGVLILTQVGHSLPEILERGLGFIKVILDYGRLDHVMELILYIIPILLVDVNALESSDLTYIMSRLVHADQTYLSIAKTMITGTFPGPVTKELGNMVHKMVSIIDTIRVFSRKDILDLLLKLFIGVPNWNSNNCVMYLLDIVCAYAFGHNECHLTVLELFEKMHLENNKKTNSGSLFSFISSFGNHGQTLIASGNSQFSWLSYFIFQAEENYMHKSGLWRALVSELAKGKTLEDSLKDSGKSTEVNPPKSNQLIIYRWAQQAIDTPPEHPLLFVFWQRFFGLYLSRPAELIEGQNAAGVGTNFFSGMINSMYLGKIKSSLKSFIKHFEKQLNSSEKKDQVICDEICKLFRTFYIWIDETKIMDSSLYIPALTPVYDPAKLVKLMSGDSTIWMEYFDRKITEKICSESVKEWNLLHFRQLMEKKNVPHNLLASRTPKERIIQRLNFNESRLPAPLLRRLANPIPRFSEPTSNDALSQALMGPLQTLNDFSDNHCMNISGYGSFNCSYLEIIENLWKNEEVSVYVPAACSGRTVGKEHIACSGPAIVNLIFTEAKKQEGIAVKLEANRKNHAEVEHKLLAAIPPKYVIAATVLNNIITKILKAFEKDLGKGVRSIHLTLASNLFCHLARSTSENWLSVPPLRHFVSECLDNLATIVASQGECRAEMILDLLQASPHLSSILTPHFSPNSSDLLTVYTKITQLPDGDGSISFVLLSKLDIVEWLSLVPNEADVLMLLGLIFRNFEITGNQPEESRLMIHGLHRKHMSQILKYNFPAKYITILKTVLNLCGLNQIDPEIVYDILRVVVNSKSQIDSKTDTEIVQEVLHSFAKENSCEYLIVLSVISEVASHFEKDRLKFGLYGLYPKYRTYLKPLCYLFTMLSLQMIHAEISKNKGVLTTEATDYLWRNMITLYDPWLSPINPSSKLTTANWIQQLSDEGESLMPWIPGDSSLAKMMFDSLSQSLIVIIEFEGKKDLLSKLLSMYSSYYASAGTKDHIFGVVHPALASLDWSTFSPTVRDIDAMMKIISMFLPQSHAFLGTIFVQINWQFLLVQKMNELEYVKRAVPSVFCLMIKLSSEPSVRQGGRLLSIVTQSESWPWELVEFAHFESLVQWYVMSVDCRCIVKHKDRSPLDAAIIRLFLAAAEFSSEHQNSNSEKKQVMWIKCCAKLLSSVCNKQKNFLSVNQPALHTTLRNLLEQMNKIGSSTSSGIIVKDYLSIFNTTSSSVLPGSALVVTQSWLTQTSPSSSLVPALLSLAGTMVKDARLASSLLESTLETYFKEENSTASWGHAKQLIIWPSGIKIKEVLDQSVQLGNGLVIYAFIDLKHGECLNSQEEQVLASSLLEYIRLLQSVSVPGLEFKLPILYKKLAQLLYRQVELSKDSAWAINSLGQFYEILISISDTSPGWSQNILGAIGLGEIFFKLQKKILIQKKNFSQFFFIFPLK